MNANFDFVTRCFECGNVIEDGENFCSCGCCDFVQSASVSGENDQVIENVIADPDGVYAKFSAMSKDELVVIALELYYNLKG